MLVEERGYLGRVGSGCAAKNTEAVRSTSFARLSPRVPEGATATGAPSVAGRSR